DDVGRLQAAGLDAKPLAPDIERFAPDDWRARTPITALIRGLGQFGQRAPSQLRDMERAIEVEHPDALLIDEGAWGAAAAAEHSGLPWAYTIVSPVPLPSRDAPPFGLGLRPRHDLVGRVRDATVGRLALLALERLIARWVNPLRAGLGLPPVRRIGDVYLAAPLVLAYTAEPFEYPRSDWSPKVRLVGPGLWEPPAETPAWLDALDRPLVLVTCSTLFQNDRQLVEVASAAFAGEPYDVIVTTADVDGSAVTPPANVRIERYVPHTPVLERAACVVCHAGMGITQKALAHGVPVVAVPFGRDQPEVARRVEVAAAGVLLPRRQFRPDRLRDAVRRAIELRPGAERIAAAFAKAGGPAAAADALEGLVGVPPLGREASGLIQPTVAAVGG
ncbi:MAG TPA: nucleotide disphospho-sugar-binding domain-containing protein, partial [Candidatus Limnocylindrales bacterium]